MTNYRELPPIPEAERPEPRDTASQTLLSREAVCPRSAYLYMRHHGGVGSHPMDRGSAFHEFARRATTLLIEQDEQRLPPELAKDLVVAVVEEHPEWVIPPGEMEALRVQAYHWAEGMVIDPSQVMAVERIFELELAGFTVRGKVDLALAFENTILLRDYKSGFELPSQQKFEAGLQLPIYALLVGEGKPEGEDFCLGERALFFDLAEVYPMYLWGEGLAFRGRTLERRELVDQKLYVEALLNRLRSRYETGDWPAVPGSHCTTCSARSECPLPAHLRDHAGSIDSPDDAAEVAEKLELDEADVKERKAELKNYANFEGPIRYGADQVWEFAEEERRSTDYDALQAGVERAVEFGEPFNVEDFIKTSKSTRFKKRRLDPDELLAEQADERTADEKYGAEAPF